MTTATLGERIRKLRQGLGLTQRQLAEAAGIDFTYLSKIENGRLEHTPSLRTLQKLAEVLKADELEILELADKLPSFMVKLREMAHGRETLQPFRKAQTPVGKRPRLTARSLLASELIGLWKNRKDLKDSAEYARQLRRQVQSRRK